MTDDKQSNDSYQKVLIFIFVRFKADPYYNNTRLLSLFLYFQDLEKVFGSVTIQSVILDKFNWTGQKRCRIRKRGKIIYD